MADKRPPLTEAQLERIAELTEDGRYTVARIARMVGCSEGSVGWAQLKLGVDRHPTKPLPPVPTEPVVARRGEHVVRRYTQAEDAELLRLEAQGLPAYRIGKRLGRRANSIVGRLRTLARREARAEAIAESTTPERPHAS